MRSDCSNKQTSWVLSRVTKRRQLRKTNCISTLVTLQIRNMYREYINLKSIMHTTKTMNNYKDKMSVWTADLMDLKLENFWKNKVVVCYRWKPIEQRHPANKIRSGWSRASRHPFTLICAARGSAWLIPIDLNKVYTPTSEDTTSQAYIKVIKLIHKKILRLQHGLR